MLASRMVLLPLALAAEPTDLQAHFRVDTAHAIQVQKLELPAGSFHLRAWAGIAAPILAELPGLQQEAFPIGWALEGTGAVELLPPPIFRLRFANQQVVQGFSTAAEMASVATGQPFHARALNLMILGELDLDLKGEPATFENVRPFERRLQLLAELDSSQFLDLLSPHRALVDVQTDHRYGQLDPGTQRVGVESDYFLTAHRSGSCWDLWSMGEDHAANQRSSAWWQVGCNATPPPVREVAIRSRVQLEDPGSDFHLSLTGSGSIEVEARRETRSFMLNLSGLREAEGPEELPLPTLTTQRPARIQLVGQNGGLVAVVTLDTPLQPGDRMSVDYAWKDAWEWHRASNLMNMGRATYPRNPYPTVEDDTVGGGDLKLSVGLPSGAAAQVMMGGDEEVTVEGGVRWTRVDLPRRDAYHAVEVGAWLAADVPAAPGIPAIHVRIFPEEADSLSFFGPSAQTILSWASGLLPPLPATSLDVLQVPDGWFRSTSVAVHEQVVLQQMQYLTDRAVTDLPNNGLHLLAHELMHQYWGILVAPRSRDDWWLGETLAEFYADLFIGAAGSKADYQQRVALHKEACEGLPADAIVSPVRFDYNNKSARVSRYDCAPYVIEALIRPLVGDNVLLGALDRFARSHAGRRFDAEQLLADIDAATPVDLSVLYESWFYVGLRPQLKVKSEQSGDQLLVQVQSNLPFGRLDVPIEVRDQNGARRLQLRIQDGTGSLKERVSGRAAAKLDPDNVLLLRR